jgi:hypothetical protein
MDIKLANLFKEMLYDAYVECYVYEDYSGRGMYGNETTAIVGDFSASELLQIVLKRVQDGYLVENDLENIKISDLRQDSMGLGVVIY